MNIAIETANVPKFRDLVKSYAEERGFTIAEMTFMPHQNEKHKSMVMLDDQVVKKLSVTVLEELGRL